MLAVVLMKQSGYFFILRIGGVPFFIHVLVPDLYVDIHYRRAGEFFEYFLKFHDMKSFECGGILATEIEFQQFLIGVVADVSVTGGHAVEGRIMAEHQDAVLGQLEIEFHDIHAHPDDGFDGGEGVFRIVAPVAAVGDDDDVFRIGIVQGGHHFFRLVHRSGFRAAGQHRERRQDKKGQVLCFNHIAVIGPTQQIYVFFTIFVLVMNVKSGKHSDKTNRSMSTAACRADFVGSFLRPEALKRARAAFAAGEISAAALKSVEDEAIRALVAKQKELGFHVVTDGEFRRQAWHLDFMWGFEGVGHAPTKTGLPFHGEQAMIDDTFLTGKLALKGEHPFVQHFRFVKALAGPDAEAKLTVPAPAQFLAQMAMPFAWGHSKQFYADRESLCDDLAAAYKAFIGQLYDAGCRRLQLDDCTWGMLVDPVATQFFGTDEAGLEEVKETHLNLNNRVIEGKPADLFINTHVCRGNYHSTYANAGAYDKVAAYLFEKENVNAYFLEFDDARSGGFEPLSHVTGDKMVVLGLITTKSPKLEFKSVVADRIRQAARYIPLDRLCVSPQCGFASCEIGNKLTEEDQWAKLRLVQEVAREVWG